MFSLSLIYFIYNAINLSIKGFFGQANIKAILDLFAYHRWPDPLSISWSIYQT